MLHPKCCLLSFSTPLSWRFTVKVLANWDSRENLVQLSHCWAIIFVPTPLFWCWEGGGKSCLKIIKSSLIKHGVWENVWKVMRVRAIWLCFYGNRTNLSSVCHLFYRIGRRSKLRPVPSSASSVCHLEPGCRKTLVLCVLEMMSMCVIIINRIKLYCQTRVTWLSCVKVPFACLQLYTEARRIYLQTEGLDSPLSHKFRLAQEKKMQDMLISMIPVSHKARLYI